MSKTRPKVQKFGHISLTNTVFFFGLLEYLLLRLLTGSMSSTIAGGSTGVGLSSRFRACL